MLKRVFKLLAQYAEFKARAAAVVEMAEEIAKAADDDVLRRDVAYLRVLLERLP